MAAFSCRRGIPPRVAQHIQQIAEAIFTHAYVDAMRRTCNRGRSASGIDGHVAVGSASSEREIEKGSGKDPDTACGPELRCRK